MKKVYVTVIFIFSLNTIEAADNPTIGIAKNYFSKLVQSAIRNKMREKNIDLTDQQIARIAQAYCHVLKKKSQEVKMFVLNNIDLSVAARMYLKEGKK